MPTNSPIFSALKQQQQRWDSIRVRWLVLFLAASAVISLCAGDVWFWPTQWFSDAAEVFIWQLRLPRTLAVIVVGAALALSGAAMQNIFENPLAEPGLLGVANGAGVALTLAVFWDGVWCRSGDWGCVPLAELWLSPRYYYGSLDTIPLIPAYS